MTIHTCDIDVLVVGGGTSGSVAAIQAARAGASTMLVESGGQLGGVTTTGGVSFPGLFHAWGQQVIAGIGWNLVCRAAELERKPLPDFSCVPQRHWHHQIRISGPLYAALVEEAAVAAGVHLCYYEFPISIVFDAGMWSLGVAGRGGVRRLIRCRQLVDCTGGADVVGLLGWARMRDEQEAQPGTLIFRFAGYDPQVLDAQRIQQLYEKALEDGTLEHGDYASSKGMFINFLKVGGENAQHVFDADSSDSIAQTRTNIRGRSSLLRLMRFIRSLPGCENVRLESAQAETAVRETFRIVGETQVTHEDYITGRCYQDAISYSFYPIDIHTADGVVPKPLRRGAVPTVPLRALVPRGHDNILVAGRSVSSDRSANSALRVQASCMAMGQAAGAAAAMAAKYRTTPLLLRFSELQALLADHQAIVPCQAESHRCDSVS